VVVFNFRRSIQTTLAFFFILFWAEGSGRKEWIAGIALSRFFALRAG